MAVVAGVDGCPGGWAVAHLEVERASSARGGRWARPRFLAHEVVADLSEVTSDADLAAICVDIPIGLPGASGTRACDIQARRLLSPHGSRVFAAPVRATLAHTDDYTAACAASRALCGRALSKQAWHILAKIAQADDLAGDPRLHECHPELSFTVMRGTPIAAAKRTAEGRRARVELLCAAIEGLTGADLPRGDDHIDALACAWSAARLLTGEVLVLPTQESAPGDRGLDSAGRPMRIVA